MRCFTKKIIQLSLIFALFFLKSTGRAQTFFTLTNGSTLVNHDSVLTANSRSNRIDILEIRMGDNVTRVDWSAFNSIVALTNVIFSTNLTVIQEGAFAGCTGLKQISFPQNVKSINNSAFSWCTGITNITFTNGLESIGSSAFYGNIGIINLTLPTSVRTIGSSAFGGCTSLVEAHIPDEIQSTYDQWFSGSTNLKSLYFGGPFYSSLNLPNLEEINFGKTTSLTSQMRSFISDCPKVNNLKVSDQNPLFTSTNGIIFNKSKNTILIAPIGRSGTFTIPEYVSFIGDDAFRGCVLLTNVIVPQNLIEVGDGAFYGCKRLISISIPSGVTYIGDGAFTGCTRLVSAEVPENYLAILQTIGISSGQLDTTTLINSVANNIATNSAFISSLASNEQFISAVAEKIKTTTGNFGIATISMLTNSLAQSRTDGINNVLSNPNLWTLYTTNQIQNMAMGDLVLYKNINGQFVLNYEIEQSSDLQIWTSYQNLNQPLTGLPTNKAFVRIKMKNSQ